MKKGYFSRAKRYIWIVIACTLIAAVVGFLMVKIQKSIFQVSSTMYVVADAPSSTFSPTLTANDSIGLATNYASEIMSRSVMQYVYQYDPQIGQHGYTPDDLLADVVTTPSATTSTFLITASASSTADAVLLANDVAKGFQSYVQTRLQQQLDTERTDLQNQYAAALKQKQTIEASLVALPSNTDPHYAVDIAELNDTIHTLATLQGQLQALPTTATSNVVTIQLATAKDAIPAVKTNLILALSTGIGLLVGILVMCLVVYLNNMLWSVEQVREKLRMAYLGSISKDKGLGKNPVLASGQVIHKLADVSANLRLTGTLPGQWHAPQGAILLITSPRDTEGKTTIATALAATMARGGCAVVVVDGNLRQPATHLSLRIRPSGAGLSGLLESRASVDTTVQRTPVPGLWVLPGGAPVDAPALLLEQKMPALLTQLRKKADVVIIDGPALLSGAEASILASMADGVALVVDTLHDRLPLLLRAKEVLNSLAHVPVGVVLNRFPQQRGDSYYAIAYPGSVTADGWRSIQASPANNHGSGNELKPEPVISSSGQASLPGILGFSPPAPGVTPSRTSSSQYAPSPESQPGIEPWKR